MYEKGVKNMGDTYWNEEDDTNIICPYCGQEYEPSYDETFIGDKVADCYSENEEQTFTCDSCGKKFTMYPYLGNWRYRTETIDGEMTDDEWEENWETKQKWQKRGV